MYRFLALLSLLTPAIIHAATIPVAPGQSIQQALARAQPGDTVQVGPGVYHQRIDLNAAARGGVTIQGTPGRTILDGTGLGNGWMIYGRHVHNMTIRHFAIRNHTGGGIGLFGDTTHSSITDNYVHDNVFICCQGSGIRVTTRFDPSTNTGQGIGVIGTAHHVTIARNVIKNLVTGFTGQLPNNGTESLTVAGDISHFVIEDNLIDHGQFIGIDLIGKSAAWWGQIPGQRPTPPTPWPRQGIVRRNTVKNLKLGMGGGDVGIYCDGCRDIVFEQNRVDGSSGYCYNVSTEEDGFVTSQVILRHNVGINCTSAPFGIGPASSQAHPGVWEHWNREPV